MSENEQWIAVQQAAREAAIEECARVADGFGYNMDIAKMLAAAIRALKEKKNASHSS